MFTGLHAAVLVAILGFTALAITVARRSPHPPVPTKTGRAIGIAYLAAWVTTYVFLLFPPLHDPPKTYPLQLCHWNAVAAALLLATRRLRDGAAAAAMGLQQETRYSAPWTFVTASQRRSATRR